MAWNDPTLDIKKGPVRRAIDMTGVDASLDNASQEFEALSAEQAQRLGAVVKDAQPGVGAAPTFTPAEFAINASTGEIALPDGRIVKGDAPTIMQLATLEGEGGLKIPAMSDTTMESLRKRGFRPYSQDEMRRTVDAIPTESDFWGEAWASGKATLGLMASSIDAMIGNDDPGNAWTSAQADLAKTQSIGQVKAGQGRFYSSFDSFLSSLGETTGNIGGTIVGAVPVAAAGAGLGALGGGGVGAAPGTLIGIGAGVSGGAAAFGEQATEFYDTALEAMTKMDPEVLQRESALYREVLRAKPGISHDEAMKEVAIQGARVAGGVGGLIGAAEAVVGGKLAGNFLTRMGVSKAITGKLLPMDPATKKAGALARTARVTGRVGAGGAGAATTEMAESMLGQSAGAATTGVGSDNPMDYANADEGWAAALGGGIFGGLGGRSNKSDLALALGSEGSPDLNTPQATPQQLTPERDAVPGALRNLRPPPPVEPTEAQRQMGLIENVLAERFGPDWMDNIDAIAARPEGRQLIGQLMGLQREIQGTTEQPAYERRGQPAPYDGAAGPLGNVNPPLQPTPPLQGPMAVPPQTMDLQRSPEGPVSEEQGQPTPMNLQERRLAQQMQQDEMAQQSAANPAALPAPQSATIEQELMDAEDAVEQLTQQLAQRPARDPVKKHLRTALAEAKQKVADLEQQWFDAKESEPTGVAPGAAVAPAVDPNAAPTVDSPEPLAAPAERTPDGRPLGVAPAALENPEPMSPEEAASREQTQQKRRGKAGIAPAPVAAVDEAVAASQDGVSPSTPEPAGDIAAQLDALRDPSSGRDAVFVAEGNESAIPQGIAGAQVVRRAGVGTLITTNAAKAREFRSKKLNDAKIQQLLGYSENKADVLAKGEEPVVVQARTAKGVAAEQLASKPGKAAAAIAVSKQAPKGAKVVTTTIAKAQADRKARGKETPAKVVPPKAAAAIKKSKEKKTPPKKVPKKAAKDDEKTTGPSEAQIEAGNYAKRSVKVGGLDLSIETEAGQKRRPEWPALKNAYGYIKRTLGKDGDHVDVFMGDEANASTMPVFIVDQYVGGKFDEHKVMLGFPTSEAARTAYKSNYAKGWKGDGTITEMAFDDFKVWVRDSKFTKQRAERSAGNVATVTDRAIAANVQADQPAAADAVEKAGTRKPATVRAAGKVMNLPTKLTNRRGNKGTTVDLRVEAIDEAELFRVGQLLAGETLNASDRAAAEATMRDFDQLGTLMDAVTAAAEEKLRTKYAEAPDGTDFMREAETRQLEVENADTRGKQGRPRAKPRTSPLAYLPLLLSETKGFLNAMRAEAKAELANYQPAVSTFRQMLSAVSNVPDTVMQHELDAKRVLKAFSELTDAQLEELAPRTHDQIRDTTIAKMVMRGATEVAHAMRRQEVDAIGSRDTGKTFDMVLDEAGVTKLSHVDEVGTIPDEARGVINAWVKQFEKGGNKFSAPITVMSMSDMRKAFPHDFTNGVWPRGRLKVVGTPDGRPSQYIVAVDWASFKAPAAALETLAHEFGHVVTLELYNRADPRTKRAIEKAHAAWLETTKGISVDTMLRRDMTGAARITAGPLGHMNVDYVRSLDEWSARQVAHYLMDPDRPHLGVVEKFFKAIADALRTIYAQVTGHTKPDAAWAEAIDRWVTGSTQALPTREISDARYDMALEAAGMATDQMPTEDKVSRLLGISDTKQIKAIVDILHGKTNTAEVESVMADATQGTAMGFLKRVGLSLMTMRQIERQYRDTPLGKSLTGWVRNIQLKAKTANAMMEAGSQAMERANLLAPRTRELLEKIMYEATHFGIHPDLPITDPKNKHLLDGSDEVKAINQKRYNGIRAKWDLAARSDGRVPSVYAGLRDAFTDLHEKTLAKQLELIETANFSQAVKDEISARIKKAQRELRVGPYFPLMRFGNWIVKVILPSHMVGVGGKENGAVFTTKTAAREEMRNQRAISPGAKVTVEKMDEGWAVRVYQQGVYFFENEAQAKRAMPEIEAEVRENYLQQGRDFDATQAALEPLNAEDQNLIISQPREGRDNYGDTKRGTPEFMQEVRNLVLQKKMDPEVAATLERLAVEALPENNYRQSLLPRQNIFGASKQMLRAYAHRYQGAAHHYSTVEHGAAINRNWSAAWEVNKSYSPAGRVLNVLEAAQKVAGDRMKSSVTNTIFNTVSDASSMFSLGFSPAYVLTNALQPWVVTLPVLSGLTKANGTTVGVAQAAKYLKAAYAGAVPFFTERGFNDFINESKALANKRGSDITLQETALRIFDEFGKTPGEKAMLESLLERGTLDFSWLNSLEDAMRGGKIGARWANLQRLGMAFPQQVETMNRVTTALAAYRLAKDERMFPDEETLQRFADDTVADTQLDYSRMNRPMAFNLPGLNVMLQFKLYMQGMYMLFARNLAIATRGATAEERKQGRKTVAYLFASHAAAAGASGLGPAAAMAKMALVAYAMMTDDEDDDWKSGEQLQAEMLEDLFGEYAGTVANKGLPALLGVDMSDRIGIPVLADSRFANIRGDDNAGAKMDKWVIYGLGAPYANFKRVTTGVGAAADGDWGAAAKGLPTALRSLVRSGQWHTQGILDNDGDVFVQRSNLNWKDITVNGLGLSPLKTSQAYNDRTQLKRTTAEIMDARKRVVRDYRNGDSGRDEVEEFNKTVPKHFQISAAQLKQAVKAKAARENGKVRADEAVVKKMLGQ